MGQYTGQWMQAAANTASGALGIGIQRLGAKYDRRQQIATQEKLMGIQMQGEKEMMDYQNMKQMEMWQNTGYGAQTKQMKEAGLNPALIYGMKGGGGQTVGGGVPSVTGGQAGYVDTTGMGIQMGMQAALQAAQIENIKANTNKTNVDAAKTEGVDTEEAQTRILDLTQGIENKKAQQTLTEVQTGIGKIEERIKGESADDAIELIGWSLNKMQNEVEGLYQDNIVKKAASADLIRKIKGEMLGVFVLNEMHKAQTTKTAGVDTRKSEAEIMQIIRTGVQKWQEIEISRQNANQQGSKIEHDKWTNDLQESTKLPIDVIEKAIQAIILKNMISPNQQTPIRGFHNR